ncbi:MAG: aminoglycoside phosphotransferase family protein [Chloroflexi bacterium]|jgi:aminoglycoside phosphotransferase (APT) family kinase protein|nr:aminoglycoside phosphotransferase family protein [Chloroflexota bacterium]
MIESGTGRISDALLDWLQAVLGGETQITRVVPQDGGTSSALYLVDARRGGRDLHLLLRRYTNSEWLAEEPDLPHHEAAALERARRASVPTPELVALDADGAAAGTPSLLMTRLPGAVVLQPRDFDGWLRQQAQALLSIHTLDAHDLPWRYFPYNHPAEMHPPVWSQAQELWEQAIDIARGPAPDHRLCFIHRDFHPVNVLFQDSHLSGVVDWPNACSGPPGADAAWMRINLALGWGPQAAEHFLQIYQEQAGGGGGYHPYLDLLAILEWLPGPPEVYPPWVTFGLRGLTGARMIASIESHLQSVLKKLG